VHNRIFIQCGILKEVPDDKIYEAIDVVLKNQFPNDARIHKCIMTYIENNYKAYNLATFALLCDQNKIATAIQPYIVEAKSSCKTVQTSRIKKPKLLNDDFNSATKILIGIMILLLGMAIACLLYFICRRIE